MACDAKILGAMTQIRQFLGIDGLSEKKSAKIPACPGKITVDQTSISLTTEVPRPGGGVNFVGVVVACTGDSYCKIIDNQSGTPITDIKPSQFNAARQWLLANYIGK